MLEADTLDSSEDRQVVNPWVALNYPPPSPKAYGFAAFAPSTTYAARPFSFTHH
jgi:hypothetical protein